MIMKKIILGISTITLLGSCTGGWNKENRAAYMEACNDSHNVTGMSEAQRKAYCSCSLEEVMKHYTTIEEVIENKDSAAINNVMLQCRANALK